MNSNFIGLYKSTADWEYIVIKVNLDTKRARSVAVFVDPVKMIEYNLNYYIKNYVRLIDFNKKFNLNKQHYNYIKFMKPIYTCDTIQEMEQYIFSNWPELIMEG